MTHRADASELLDDRGYSGPLVRGANPAALFEKATRDRITDSYYWKEQCFGLNAATLCDRVVDDVSCVGGTYGIAQKPTPFLCLAFKLLQLAPPVEIVLEYLNFHDPGNEPEGDGDGNQEADPAEDADRAVLKAVGDFKYLRALAAFYIRLTFPAVEIYRTLEPLLSDYRKLRRRTREGFVLTYVDQFVDDLLTKDRVCGTSLWKLPSRQMLEDLDLLDERTSPLADELESESGSEEGSEEGSGSGGDN